MVGFPDPLTGAEIVGVSRRVRNLISLRQDAMVAGQLQR